MVVRALRCEHEVANAQRMQTCPSTCSETPSFGQVWACKILFLGSLSSCYGSREWK